MAEASDERRVTDVVEWFRERGVTLEFSPIAGDREAVEWFALMLPPGEKFGPGGVGITKLAAAEDARRRFIDYYGEDRRFGSAVVEKSGGASLKLGGGGSAQVTSITLAEERDEALPVAPDVREPLERVAGEHGWLISFTVEPEGSIRWFVFDRDGDVLLKQGAASTWDDARLEMIEDLYPPSGEQ